MSEPTPSKSQFLVYRDESGQARIDVLFEGDTVWLTQAQLAELFNTSQQNVSLHIRNIYEEDELTPTATHKEYLSVRSEGTRDVSRKRAHYNLDMIISFFSTVQNKLHWAITGQTAAEVVQSRADATKPNMGLTSWRNPRIHKSDVSITKNYYTEPELSGRQNLTEQYLVFAAGQAERRVPMRMAHWVSKLDGFLTLNDREILRDAGRE